VPDGLGELEDEVYIRGLDDWSTIEKDEKIVCRNCFQSTHRTTDCEYVLATVIRESPVKEAKNEEPGVKCVDNAVRDGLIDNTNNMLDGELKDEELNEAYDELLTQKFNPDVEDFENYQDDALDGQKPIDQKPGKLIIIRTRSAFTLLLIECISWLFLDLSLLTLCTLGILKEFQVVAVRQRSTAIY
jgi:hypothetical protein